VTLIILLLIWRAKRTTPIGLLGVLWFGLSIAPMWASRDFLYNEYAPRLLYLAGAGASLAIAAIMGPVRESASQGVSIHSAVGVGAIALIVLQSGQFVIARQVLHEDAFRLLDQENRAMFMLRRGSVLFINAVELFTFRESEFPLGWFGVLASPWHNRIVTDKNLRAQNADWVIDPVQAQQVQDRSRLALEFHGRVLAPDQLRAAVVAASEVYRVEAVTPSRPNPSPSEAGPTGEGDLHLFKIAAIEHTVEPAVSFMAEWAAPIRLITASVDIEAGTLVLNLDWSIGGPLGAGQTVFVHVRNAAGAIVAQADGDSVGGLAPLSSWTAGDRVQERRPLILPSDLPAGTYTIALGLYDRASLQRAIPTRTSGIVITDGALIVATFNYP
jgi:hypothetical protein